MNALPQLLLTTVLASAVSVTVTLFVVDRDDATPPPIDADPTAALATRVDDLEAKLAAAQQELAVRSSQPAPARAEVPSVDPATIDRAVARYFETHGDTLAIESAAMDKSAAASFDPKALLTDLRTVDRSWEEIQAIVSKLSTEQKDALIAEFEMVAEASPNDPDIQNELGEIYVHRLMNEDMLGMMKYGQLAEKQFDRALELNDQHWGARFNKAMSLANQPAFLGRRPEAIQHLETLVSQQEGAPPEAKHAQTYIILGNLHAQSGDPDKAKQVWENGLSRFPDAEGLRQKLGR